MMRRIITAAMAAALLGALALAVWNHFLRDGEGVVFQDPAEHFKYGSIGAERTGIPYALWRAMPTLCADKLPGGYASFGFITEPGHELPVGLSVRQYGVPRIGFNCATCHTSTVNGGPSVLLGAPAVRLDLQRYIRFIIDCGTDPRFTTTGVLQAMRDAGVRLRFYDELAYRLYIIAKARKEFARQKRDFAWMDSRPAHGPGRTDPLGGWKQRFELLDGDATVATVDLPSLWNQGIREHLWLHWDADNNSLLERNLSAALAGGATESSLDLPAIERVTAWLRALPPPAYPFPIDERLAEAGRLIYEREGCNRCHDVGEAALGMATDLREVATDPERLNAFTAPLLARFLTVGEGYAWRFSHYRKPTGYANSPLDGIWARAPYLHNGSVPTLWDLLLPSLQRPASFGRGCDLYDEGHAGFRCEGPLVFDTRERGNGNGGHLFGTQLPDRERRALIEYLKRK